MGTKAESHHKLVAYGRADTVDEQVLEHLQCCGPKIRDQICDDLDMLTSTACGALSRLMKRELVVEDGTRWNETTKRNVTLYKAKQ